MNDVTYTIEIEPDDTPVRGNALASGDAAVDKECEDGILERLERGDIWAWALVKVMAQVYVGGHVFTGKAYLGCCSYENEAEFKHPDDYYPQLCQEARVDLLEQLQGAVARGEMATQALRELR